MAGMDELAQEKISSTLYYKSSVQPDEEFKFTIYGWLPEFRTVKGLRRVLIDRHQLTINPVNVDVVMRRIIFCGKGKYSTLVSACQEEWIEKIEECSGEVRIMD